MDDLLDLDARLSNDDEKLRDEVRTFVDEQVRPIIGDHFHQGAFPTQLKSEGLP
jgi:glutaryl-CoA dehydrogenase